jgi:hypothetical protein
MTDEGGDPNHDVGADYRSSPARTRTSKSNRVRWRKSDLMAVRSTSRCVKCGRELDTSPMGRPPRYCGLGCRRAIEYECRRIQRHLQDLERQERHAIRQLDPETRLAGWGDAKWAERERALVASEIKRYEERLRDLLDVRNT